jgi:hypothetical protein
MRIANVLIEEEQERINSEKADELKTTFEKLAESKRIDVDRISYEYNLKTREACKKKQQQVSSKGKQEKSTKRSISPQSGQEERRTQNSNDNSPKKWSSHSMFS